MLASAFDGDSNSVSLDILTSEDLDALRQSSGLTGGPARVNPAGPSSKRYLILTYQGEFDKVHYPMALAFSETEDVSELKRSIVQLRDELEGLRRSELDSSRVQEWEQMASSFRLEKEKLERELRERSIEKDRLLGLVESLKSDNHSLRLRVDFLESSHRSSSKKQQLVSSPANSLRRGIASPSRSSPYRNRPPAPVSPSRRPPLARGMVSPIRRPPSLRSSPASSVRSITSPKPPRLPKPTGAAPLSEVDARLQALQNFLRHQKSAIRTLQK